MPRPKYTLPSAATAMPSASTLCFERLPAVGDHDQPVRRDRRRRYRRTRPTLPSSGDEHALAARHRLAESAPCRSARRCPAGPKTGCACLPARRRRYRSADECARRSPLPPACRRAGSERCSCWSDRPAACRTVKPGTSICTGGGSFTLGIGRSEASSRRHRHGAQLAVLGLQVPIDFRRSRRRASRRS